MRSPLRLLCCLPLVLAACRAPASAPAPGAMEPSARPLASLAAQRVVVAPAYRIRTADPLGWAAQIPRSREHLKSLDDEIALVLGERGLKTQWVYTPDLLRSMRSSPTYAVDPHAMAVEPLRNPAVTAGAKIGDPLLTQLRTLVALHDSRAVLIPVELRFDRETSGQGIAILRVALVDGRLGEVRWAGDVRSDPSPTLSRALLTSLAARLADLVTAP